MAPTFRSSSATFHDDTIEEIKSHLAPRKFSQDAYDISRDSLSPAQVADALTPRSETTTTRVKPGEGSIDPGSINMQGLLALFAILGAAFVLGGIWFFFWAKNGGFIWRKGDWEEYKSTVLRRKGPDGQTLSNATRSTKLGGGSIVAGTEGYTDYDGDDVTRAMTGDNGTYADTEYSEKPRKKRGRRIRDKFRRKGKGEQWEGQYDEDVRAYRNEKPARVGGINREADGTYHEGSTAYTGTNTNPEMSEWAQSDLGDGHRRYDEYSEYTRGSERGQQRNVTGYSFTVGDETERNLEKGQQRNASGFSFTAGEDTVSYVTEERRLWDETTTNASSNRRTRRHERSSQRPRGPRPSTRHSSPRKQDRRAMPGGYTTPLDMSSVSASDYTYEQVAEEDSGTRSYHHPIPELSKGYRRGGGRRRRRDSLSDSDGDDYDSRYS